MSYLLEMLGRGLLANLWGAFPDQLPLDERVTLEEHAGAVRSAEGEDDVVATARYGVALLRNERFVEARELYATLLKRVPDHVPGLLGLACAVEQLGQRDRAATLLQRAAELEPQNPAIAFCIGYCHELDARPDEALAQYQAALALCPGLRNAHERIAAIQLQAGRIEQAIESYTQLCEWEPQQTDLHLTLANLLLQAGRTQPAIERYEHALVLEPDNWVAHDDAATAYEKAGQYREAIEHLHKVIEREPNFADSYVRLGDLYSNAGDDDAAMQNYMHAVELHPEYLEASVKIGTQHLRFGRFSDAAKWFTMAIEINDRLLTAYVGLGVAQDAAGRTKESRETFDLAAGIVPNSTLLFSEMARMQLKAAAPLQADELLSFEAPSEDDDEAVAAPNDVENLINEQIERHRTALEKNPNQADLHYRLGLLMKHAGDADSALRHFREAIEINPTYVKAIIKFGLTQLEQGDTDDAVETLRRAVALEPKYVDLHYQLGLAFARRQQFSLAVEHFEYAAAGNPKNADFQANLGLALQHLGLVDRASACWESVLALAPESEHAPAANKFLLKNRFSMP